jgi:predicted ATPase
MGAGAAVIAEVVRDVREQFPDLESPPVLEPHQARFRLFDSITRFLKMSSQAQPLVLALDNLHCADQSALQLREFLAQELIESRLLVVGTFRDTELTLRHPLAQTLGELGREPSFQRKLLQGLSEEEVAQFITMTAGSGPPQGLVRVMHERTEGNPLFMTQVVQLLIQEGELIPERVLEYPEWSIRMSDGVYEAIGRRPA